MADIFISYAKEDQSRARLLAALLEAQGYTVWWDTSLLSGDNFRRRIMTELGKARAVIVIWTRNSVASDWVQSEAGRGHASRVLIPLKAADVEYGDIPPPFDTLHTEPIEAEDKIVAAVIAQLARPESNPTPVSRLSKQLRHQMIAWVGAAGGALTLFTNLGALVQLSGWAKWIVASWLDWTRAFWEWISGLLGISIPPYLQRDLTFMLFLLIVAVGSHINYALLTGDRSMPLFKFGNVIGWHALAACAWLVGYMVAGYYFMSFLYYQAGVPYETLSLLNTMFNFLLIMVFVFLLVFRWPRSSAINTAFAIGIIGTIFFEASFAGDTAGELAAENLVYRFALLLALSLLCILVAPPILFHRRLWTLLGFLVLLVLGNEVAKLGLTA